MRAVLYTAPTIEPLTVEELMFQSVVDDETGVWVDFLTDKLIGARRHVENITRRALLTQTWDYYLDAFPTGNAIKIPFGNLQTVTHVKSTDSDGDQTTMTVTTEYIVETNGEQCGRIVLPYSVAWPSFTAYPSNPIVVRFVCGWTTRALVPYEIKAAIAMIATDLIQNREAQMLGNPNSLAYQKNETVGKLLSSAKLWDEF